MTGEDYELEKALIEMCDASNQLETTPRIRCKKHAGWKLEDTSLWHFMSTLQGDDKILLKNFIHTDTWCNATDMTPSYWRVQGFICLGDILDWLEHFDTQDNRQIALSNLLKKICFDKWYSVEDWNNCNWDKGEYIVVRHRDMTFIKIIEYDALCRIL